MSKTMPNSIAASHQHRESDPVLLFARRYQAFFNGIKDGIVIVCGEFEILDANPRFLTLFGSTYPDLLKRRFTDLFHQDNQADLILAVKRVIERQTEKETLECIFFSHKKQAFTVELNFSLLEGQYGHDTSVMVIVRDVSERREMENRLQQKADEFQNVFDSAPAIFVIIDERRRICRMNQTGLNALNKTAGQVKGRRIGDVIQCANHYQSARGCGFGASCKLCKIRESILRSLKAGETVSKGEQCIAEWENEDAMTCYRVAAKPMESRDGLQVLLVLENITDIKKAAHETEQLHNSIARANVELKQTLEKFARSQTQLLESQKLEQVGLLASGFAHNLRTPLAGIKGYTQLLKMDHPDFDELELILSEIHVMEDIISNLMLKSRKDHEEGDSLVSINDIIEIELKFLNANLFFRHDVIKQIYLDDELPLVRGVYSHFSQIFANLIQNALDAMYSAPQKKLTIRTRHDDRFVFIEIQDTGSGIPENIREKIFDAFFTTKGSTLDRKGNEPVGTGLGLNSVNHFITRYGGHLAIDSVPGQGTVMQVRLPCHSHQAAAVPRLLIVDDEESIVNILVHVCQDLDMEAYGTTNGQTALELYAQHLPHIVVTDLCMPGLTGTEMMAEIRRKNPDQKAIYISGYADNPDFNGWLENELKRQNCCAVLKKPFQLEQFRQIIDELLPEELQRPAEMPLANI